MKFIVSTQDDIKIANSDIPLGFLNSIECSTFEDLIRSLEPFVIWYVDTAIRRSVKIKTFSIYQFEPRPLYSFTYLYSSKLIDHLNFTIGLNDMARLLVLPKSFSSLESRLQVLNIPIRYENSS